MQKSSVDMAITTDLVEAFLKCPTKCFLRARAEVATGNAYADWVRAVFRSEGITRLVAGVEPDKCATSTAGTECAGSAQWQLALDFTAGRENLRCSFDAVERIPSAGRGRAAQFVPIRFVIRQRIPGRPIHASRLGVPRRTRHNASTWSDRRNSAT
jgi:hypothetical protein